MNFGITIGMVLILFLLAENLPGQSTMTFNDQGWNSDQILPSNFRVGKYAFNSNNPFYTNYGFNFNVNDVSLYYVFQNAASDKITITTLNNELFDLNSFAAYQVSETGIDTLLVEGWKGTNLKYNRSFTNDTSWKTFTLNYNNVNKIVIYSSFVPAGGLIDYNFDNLNFTSGSSQDSAGTIPAGYHLSQNYPNPFNPSTTINYSITNPGLVVLKVYDIIGKEVATLVNGNKVPGNYSVTFYASNLPSGIYVYELKTNSFLLTNKMVLLK